MIGVLRGARIGAVAIIVLTLGSCANRGGGSASVRSKDALNLHWEPATGETLTFDPSHPPPDMPPIRPDPSTICRSVFRCRATVNVDVSAGVLTVTGIDATLQLHTIVWLPNNYTAKMRAYAEGMREVSQRVHARGREVATEIARRYLGRTRKIPAGVDIRPDSPDLKRLIESIGQEFCRDHTDRMQGDDQAAQAKYASLTDFGRNGTSVPDAIDAAIGPTSAP